MHVLASESEHALLRCDSLELFTILRYSRHQVHLHVGCFAGAVVVAWDLAHEHKPVDSVKLNLSGSFIEILSS